MRTLKENFCCKSKIFSFVNQNTMGKKRLTKKFIFYRKSMCYNLTNKKMLNKLVKTHEFVLIMELRYDIFRIQIQLINECLLYLQILRIRIQRIKNIKTNIL